MADTTPGSPIYDELVRQRGDAVAESRAAERQARSEMEEVLHAFRTDNRASGTGWFH
jgi:hypothetical protein